MDIEKLKGLSEKVRNQRELIKTEEATKTAFVLPFIQLLGYNVFDPREVIPEYTADIGTKKGEKIDYAIMKDGRPIILIECKKCDDGLSQSHVSQLYRYFATTKVKVAVLTNGLEYWMFADTGRSNVMDSKPFLKFHIQEEWSDDTLKKMKNFSKPEFDIDKIMPLANHLMYENAVIKYLEAQIAEPDTDFVKFLTKRVYDGQRSRSIIEKFTLVTKISLNKLIETRVNERVVSILNAKSKDIVSDGGAEDAGDGIETLEEELEGFYIVKAICRKYVSASRIIYKDNASYFPIFLDHRNKTLCRLDLHGQRKSIFLPNQAHDGYVRYTIAGVDDIYKFARQLKEVVRRFESAKDAKDSSSYTPVLDISDFAS